ncbi:MAG: hypothetical protein U0326_40670 [Polyangiales bacterium]
MPTDRVRKHFETYMFGNGHPPLSIDCVQREFGVSTQATPRRTRGPGALASGASTRSSATMKLSSARSTRASDRHGFSWALVLALLAGCSDSPAAGDAAVNDRADAVQVDTSPSLDAPQDVADATAADATSPPADTSAKDVTSPPADTSTDVASADVASADVASADVASADVASADVTSADVASSDVASADVVSADAADSADSASMVHPDAFWYTGAWNPSMCPTPCISGTTQTRTVFCTNSAFAFLPASACAGPMPATSNICC